MTIILLLNNKTIAKY